jgi:hypothetical protein
LRLPLTPELDAFLSKKSQFKKGGRIAEVNWSAMMALNGLGLGGDGDLAIIEIHWFCPMPFPRNSSPCRTR